MKEGEGKGGSAGSGSGLVLDGVSATRYLPEPDGKYADPDPQDFVFRLKRGAGARSAPVAVRIDVGSLDGIATAGRLSERCHYAEDRAYVACEYPAGSDDVEVKPFALTLTHKAAPGDHGKVTVTASTGTGTGAETRSTGEVWAGTPQLHMSAEFEKKIQPSGGTARVRMSIRNSGKVPADAGFGITVEPAEHVTPTQLPSNCGRSTDADNIAVCRFDGRSLAPGATVTLDRALALHVPEHLLHTTLDLSAWAVGSPDDPRLPGNAYRKGDRYYGHWQQGKADVPAVGLRRRTEGGGDFEKYPREWIHTDAHLDVSALAGTIRGKEGETVEVPIRVGERWPDGSGDRPLHVDYVYRFTAPEGTTVLHGPMDSGEPICTGGDHGGVASGGRTFTCGRGPADESITLRIDRAVPGATARVEILHSEKLSARDPVRANDRATLALHVDGTTPQLRARRITSTAAPWAVAAAVLLAAGGVLYRRRGRRRTP